MAELSVNGTRDSGAAADTRHVRAYVIQEYLVVAITNLFPCLLLCRVIDQQCCQTGNEQ